MDRDLEPRLIQGLELRYVLTVVLLERGPSSVADLCGALDAAGFRVAGRPAKTVSDSLRWEMAKQRVVRLGWGRYGPGRMPASTRSRIRSRVRGLQR